MFGFGADPFFFGAAEGHLVEVFFVVGVSKKNPVDNQVYISANRAGEVAVVG